jgi:transcription initiation factor TFIID TATA-box-binding protein
VGGAPKIEVQNMVASIDFGKRFDLERIAWNFDNTEYEPEVFPGLVFRVEDPKAVVLIFVSGKGICAGVKSMRDVKRAARKTGKILQGYISK